VPVDVALPVEGDLNNVRLIVPEVPALTTREADDSVDFRLCLTPFSFVGLVSGEDADVDD
jgi:hypothetical protein